MFAPPSGGRRGAGAALALALALGMLVATRPAPAADEIHWTLTGQNSVSFSWRGTNAERVLRYDTHHWALFKSVVGMAPNPMPNSSAGPFWEARLTGLQENTLYHYRIGSGPIHTFRTPPPRGSSDFWFAEQADVGSTLGWVNVGITQNMIPSNLPALSGDDRPRFVLVAGDLTYGDQNTLADVDRHFNDVMAWSQDAAYMPAWGNHEWDLGGEVDHLNNYEGRFDLPNSRTTPASSVAVGNGPGEDWYWFDYGNARFIAFPEPFDDTWDVWAADVAPVMADAQNDPAIRFIITFGHRPAWSSGADHGNNPSLAAHMMSLHGQYPKYALGFHAHSHHYERTEPALTGGMLFIVGAGGGSSLGGLTATQPAWSAFRRNYLHHLRIHVQEDRIDGYAICGPPASGAIGTCPQGTVMDTWSVIAAPIVAVGDPPVAAAGLRLGAEPNPARGSLTIRIEAEPGGDHVLEVLDLSGRLVRRLSSGPLEGGARRVRWDGTDESGRAVAAGIYQVLLLAGARSAQTRVAILR
jgi:hypothetical protein